MLLHYDTSQLRCWLVIGSRSAKRDANMTITQRAQWDATDLVQSTSNTIVLLLVRTHYNTINEYARLVLGTIQLTQSTKIVGTN